MHQLSPCSLELESPQFYLDESNFDFTRQKLSNFNPNPALEPVNLDDLAEFPELDPNEVSIDITALINGALFPDDQKNAHHQQDGNFPTPTEARDFHADQYMPTPTAGFGPRDSEFSGWVKQELEGSLPDCQVPNTGISSGVTSPQDWTTSNCSSPSPSSASEDLPTTIEETTSGRSRRSFKAPPAGENHLKIGRKVYTKDSDEYRQRRERNNVAVRKSRDKAKKRQQHTESRVHNLSDENDRLQKRLDLLSKELSVLKGLFITVGAAIPPEYRKLFEKH